MNLLGPTGVVLAIIVICTQVLVVYNFRNKVASKIAEEEIDLAEEIEIGKSTINLLLQKKFVFIEEIEIDKSTINLLLQKKFIFILSQNISKEMALICEV